MQKRRRFLGKDPLNEKNLEVDRLSNFPDEILCHILSFLPTKHAVATSVLSNRWKNLFPSILDLRLSLHDKSFLHPEFASGNSHSFMLFVDRLLTVTLCEVRSFHSLKLICEKFTGGWHISKWVSIALYHNIKRLDLYVFRLKNSYHLLSSLFGCKLICMNLNLDFADAPQYKFSLPHLKILTVASMKFKLVNALLVGCPVLEFLYPRECYGDPGERLRICIPSLKSLWFDNLTHLEIVVELDCPNLEILNYCGFSAYCHLVRKINSLRVACLDLRQNSSQCLDQSNELALKLINVCSGVQKLCLSNKFMPMLNQLPRPLPQFENLVSLIIQNMEAYAWELLPSILKSAPRLKKVYLRKGFDKDCYESFKASLKESWMTRFSTRDGVSFLVEIQREADETDSIPSAGSGTYSLS